jgi:clan AA aspartic protease
MGLVQATIELVNSWELENARRGLIDQDTVKSMQVEMLVDTGSLYMCINETVCEQLNLPVLDKKKGQLADGRIVEYDVVGPIEVRFKNRKCLTSAMVLPGDSECLLGTIPLEEMDVLVSPNRRELIVNPEHPYYAQLKLKRIQEQPACFAGD